MQRSCLICNISKGGKKEFVKRLTHTCICVMMHRYSCSKLQLHWYVCIASALVYPLSLPTAQCSPDSAQTADMQPMWTCNCFARAIQSALLHSVYFWLLGCLQLLPVHTRVVYKEWANTVEMFRGYCQWRPLAYWKWLSLAVRTQCLLLFWAHSTYSYNIKGQKCASMGLNKF